MKLQALWPVVVLAACSPEPRAASYFQAHPDEAAEVVEACQVGSDRGPECEHAKAALAAIRRDARMRAYKKAFE